MNLDGVLVPVTDDTVVVERSSIARSVLVDGRGERPLDVLALLRAIGIDSLEVMREEATTMQACNCVCLGGGRVVAYDLSDHVAAALRARKIDVRTVPGRELIGRPGLARRRAGIKASLPAREGWSSGTWSAAEVGYGRRCSHLLLACALISGVR
jgi:N-dimethylarginine dimethylaminohydrolase